jgi:hypothetical protein
MKLRLVEFNVENLFLFIDCGKGQDVQKLTEGEWQSLSTSVIPNKPLRKVKELARIITELNPDVLMLCEVGGLESLENFNRLFLDNQYVPQFIEGNSDRGIDIAYLVRRTLGFAYDLRSHRNRPINFLYAHEIISNQTGYVPQASGEYRSHKFSRDVLELRMFHPGQAQPALINLLVHLKSKWDRDGFDPGGRDRRLAELKTLLEIYQELKSEFKGEVPILISGDFNGRAGRHQPDSEFTKIYETTRLEDCLELAGRSEEERTTYVQFANGNKAVGNQLDYIFVPELLQSAVLGSETFVYRFADELNSAYPLPSSLQMRRELPSDHYPVVATLNL